MIYPCNDPGGIEAFRSFDDAARRFVQALCRKLPPVSGLILEQRISGADPRVDLSIRFLKEAGEFQLLARLCKTAASKGAPAWSAMHRFVRCCLEDPRFASVGVVFLEFDQAVPTGGLPVPAFFFDAGSQDFVSGNIVTMLRTLGIGHSPATALLSRIGSGLPDGSSVSWLGLFLSRPAQPLRVNIRVAAAGWEETAAAVVGGTVPEALRRIVRELQPSGLTALVLDLDVWDGVSLDGGIELRPDRDCDWAPLLRRLERAGWCRRGTADRLLRWPARHAAIDDAEQLRLVTLRAPDTGAEQVFVRRLSHIKLQVKAGAVITKSYLYEGYGWLPPHLPEPPAMAGTG